MDFLTTTFDTPFVETSEEFGSRPIEFTTTFPYVFYTGPAESHSTTVGIERQITHTFTEGFFGETTLTDVLESDTGTATDTQAVSAAFADTDANSSSADSEFLEVSHTQTDAGTGVENAAALEFTGQSETGSGTETESVVKDLSLADTDTAVGAETESVQVDFDEYDFLVADDFGSADTVGSIDEIGLANDTGVVEVQFTSTDTGAATAESYFLDLLVDEQVTTVEVESLAVANAAGEVDTATSIEYEQVTAQFTNTDSGTGADTQALVIEHTQYETGVTTVVEALLASFANTDSGVAVETTVLEIFDTDGGVGADDESTFATIVSGDSSLVADDAFVAIGGDVSRDTDPYYPYVLLAQPLHYWRLSELNGNVIYDKRGISSGVYDGDLVASRGIVAGMNSALEFNATGTAQFGDIQIDWSNATLEFLVQGGDGEIFSKDGEVEVSMNAGTLTVTLYGATTTTLTAPVTTAHVALVLNGDTARLYVNGALVDSDVVFDIPNTFGNTLVADGYVGVIDDVALYQRALTAQEIAVHALQAQLFEDYENAVQELGPLHYVPLSGSLRDYAGGVEPTAGYYEYEDGPHKDLHVSSEALITADPVVYPDSEHWNVEGDLSMTYWVKPGADPVRPYYRENNWDYTVPAASMNTGEWNFVAVVFKGSDRLVYVNGELIETAAYVGVDFNNAGDIVVGETPDVPVAQAFVVPRALTEYEITHLYNLLWHGRDDLALGDESQVMVEEVGFSPFTYKPSMAFA